MDEALMSSEELNTEASKKHKRSDPKSKYFQSVAKQFSSEFIQLISSKNPESRQKIKEMKKDILDKNEMTLQQMDALEDTVGQLVKQQYSYSLKKSLLAHFFNEGSKDSLNALREKHAFNTTGTEMVELANNHLGLTLQQIVTIRSIYPFIDVKNLFDVNKTFNVEHTFDIKTFFDVKTVLRQKTL